MILQQTPLAVTAAPPLEEIVPPLVAEVDKTFEMAAVVIAGIKIGNFKPLE